MSQDNNIPVRDEQPQRDNSDKTADGMGNPGADSTQDSRENRHGEEPSGYRGENPSTAGPGGTRVDSATPENAEGRLNPSAPGDTGTTTTSTAE